MSVERNRRIDEGRRAIRAQQPRDARRETTWQYQDRLAAAVVDALFPDDTPPQKPTMQNGRPK